MESIHAPNNFQDLDIIEQCSLIAAMMIKKAWKIFHHSKRNHISPREGIRHQVWDYFPEKQKRQETKCWVVSVVLMKMLMEEQIKFLFLTLDLAKKNSQIVKLPSLLQIQLHRPIYTQYDIGGNEYMLLALFVIERHWSLLTRKTRSCLLWRESLLSGGSPLVGTFVINAMIYWTPRRTYQIWKNPNQLKQLSMPLQRNWVQTWFVLVDFVCPQEEKQNYCTHQMTKR